MARSDFGITWDDRELKGFELDLKTFAHKAFPHATKRMLNDTAFAGQKIARKKIIPAKFVQRAKGKGGAAGSVLVNRATGLKPSQQRSEMGSIQKFMADQEFGSVRRGSGTRGKPIPTQFARRAKVRNRLVATVNRLERIRLNAGPRRASFNRRRFANTGQRLMVRVKQARDSGSKFFFLDHPTKPGIYKFVRGKIKLISFMGKKSVTLRPRPWLAPTVKVTGPLMPVFYKRRLKEQLKRHGLKMRIL